MNNILKGLFDKDITQFLKNISEYNDIITGRRKCKFCNKIITIENISCIFPESGSIKYICNNPDCMKEYNYE
jgi:hypothetical protein